MSRVRFTRLRAKERKTELSGAPGARYAKTVYATTGPELKRVSTRPAQVILRLVISFMQNRVQRTESLAIVNRESAITHDPRTAPRRAAAIPGTEPRPFHRR